MSNLTHDAFLLSLCEPRTLLVERHIGDGTHYRPQGLAVFSEDRLYRYLLMRFWGHEGNPVMTFVMLNPSSAGAEKNDNTIRRCMGFAKREGCGGLIVVNPRAFIATKPDHLKRTHDPVGGRNHAFLEAVVKEAGANRYPVVVGWGAWEGSSHDPEVAFLKLCDAYGVKPLCLGNTASGAPRHPLRLAKTTPLVPFSYVSMAPAESA
jgi:hypothetical protein